MLSFARSKLGCPESTNDAALEMFERDRAAIGGTVPDA
jgi:hypothetical protein